MKKVASSSSNDFDIENPAEDIEESTNRRQRATIRLLLIVVAVLFAIIIVASFLVLAPYSPYHLSTSADPTPATFGFSDLTHEENLAVHPLVKAGIILPESSEIFGRDIQVVGHQANFALWGIKDLIGSDTTLDPYTEGVGAADTVSCKDMYILLLQYIHLSSVETLPSLAQIEADLKDAAPDKAEFSMDNPITEYQTVVLIQMLFDIGG